MSSELGLIETTVINRGITLLELQEIYNTEIKQLIAKSITLENKN